MRVQIVEMHVNIDCDGCEGKVRRSLEKLQGTQPPKFSPELSVNHALKIPSSTRSAQREHRQDARQGDGDGFGEPEEGAPCGAALRQARRAVAVRLQQPGAPPLLRAAASCGRLLPQPLPGQGRAGAGAAAAALLLQQRPARQQERRRLDGGQDAGGAVPPAGQGQLVQRDGYYNSELYGNYNEQHAVVPAGVGNYFSDENPTGACSIM